MTEEPTTPNPSLRLKPRLRPPEGGAPASSAPATSPVPVLFSDYAGPAGAAAPAPAAPVVPAIQVAPVLPATAAAVEGGKFRLKPKPDAAPVVASETSAALGDPSATIPPTPQAASAAGPASKLFSAPPLPAGAPPPPPPTPPKPATSASRPPLAGYTAPPFSRTKGPFHVPHIKATVEVPVIESPEPASERRGPVRFIVGGLTTLVVFGVGGYFAWKHFTAPKGAMAVATPAAVAGAPAKAAPAAPAGSVPATGSSPSDTLNKIAAIPGNAIAKAQDAIAARRASGQNRVDATAAGEDAPAKSSGSAAKAPPPGTATAMTSVAPGLAATTQIEAAPEASPVFLAWVVNIKVNGVFQGTPARAMINGRLTRTGEVVDGNLGITFESVDADRKHLIFKDRSGATVTRKY